MGVGVGGCYLSHERAVDPTPVVDAGTPAAPPRCRYEPVAELLLRASPTHSSKAPDLYWTGAQIGALLAEMDGDIPHPVVTRVLAEADLSSVSAPLTVGIESHGWGEGVWTEGGLALCYFGDPGGNGRTLFRRERPDGSLGPLVTIDEGGSSCLDIAAAGERLLIAWRHWAEVPEGADAEIETWLGIFDGEGARLSEPLVIARDLYPGRSVKLWASEDRFYAAHTTREGQVRLLSLSTAGEIRRELLLPTEDAAWATVAEREGRLALAWTEGPREVRSLRTMLLDESFSPLTEPRLLSDGAPPVVGVELRPLPDGWGLVWAAGSRPSFYAVWAHLDEEGRPSEPRRVFYRGQNSAYGGPSPLARGRDLYLGLSQGEEDGYEQVHLHQLRCVDTEVDLCAAEEARSGDCLGDHLYGFRWTGSDCAPVVGCEGDCVGAGCDRLAPTRFACLADHEPCGPLRPTCEGSLEAIEAEAICGPTELVANRAERLELRREMSSCEACGLSLGCEAEVIGPFELGLVATGCRAPIDCDCDPGATALLTASCLLPPLSPGTWTVRAEGVPDAEILVRPVWEEPNEEPLCRGG